MTTESPQQPADISKAAPTPVELAELREALKRCSPATFEAARQYRCTANPAFVGAIVLGVIERYVERGLRSKLAPPTDDNLRLVEDLELDSLTLMEIVLLLEDVLRMSVSNEELVTLRTIGNVRQFIGGKAAEPRINPQTQ